MTRLFGRKRTHRRHFLAAEAFLLTVGLVLLGWAGYMTCQMLVYSSWQDYKFEQALQGEQPTLGGYFGFVTEGRAAPRRSEDEQPAANVAPPVKPGRKLLEDELIGRIEIPRVKVSAVVKEGVDNDTLSRAVGHVPYTALPGEVGNVGVAAHRDTFFRGLRHVRKGDVIRVATLDGTYLYEVDSMKIVWPKNVEVLDPTPDPRITLVTCYPFNFVGKAPKRYIVQGRQVGFEAVSAQARP